MKTLYINVVDKVATYQQRGGSIVCGNSDYEVKFLFDSEWDAYEEKTARFIWGGQHTDVPFTGDTCPVPPVSNTRIVTVGVYVEGMSTTTPAVIYAQSSILCGSTPPHPDYVATQLAKEALAKAEAALGVANRAEESADLALEKGFKVVGTYEDGCVGEDGQQTFAGEVHEWNTKYHQQPGGRWFIIGSTNTYVANELRYDLGVWETNPLYTLFRTSTFVTLQFLGLDVDYAYDEYDYKEVMGGLIQLHILETMQISRPDDFMPKVKERLPNLTHTCLVEVRDCDDNSHYCLYLSDFVTSTLAFAYEYGISCALRFTGYSDRAEEVA